MRHVHELHRLDGQDFLRKEEADIQHVLEAALHILLVAGSTPDAGQRLEANEEGADDPVPCCDTVANPSLVPQHSPTG